MKKSEKEVAKEWKEYYENKGEDVYSAYALKSGKVDEDGFQRFVVQVNVEKGAYRFEQFYKV